MRPSFLLLQLLQWMGGPTAAAWLSRPYSSSAGRSSRAIRQRITRRRPTPTSWVVPSWRSELRVSTEPQRQTDAVDSSDSDSHSNTTSISLSSINPLIRTIQPSKTVEIFSLVQQLRAQGATVTSLCVGEPDFAPFSSILQALQTATAEKNTRYTAVTGTAALRQAIARDLQRRKNLNYNPDSDIIVANGAKQCVFQALWALAGAGDKVLVPAPYWPSYPEQVRLTGAEPVVVETTASEGYLLTPHKVKGGAHLSILEKSRCSFCVTPPIRRGPCTPWKNCGSSPTFWGLSRGDGPGGRNLRTTRVQRRR